MTCKVYKSESAKILENIGCLRFVKNKMKPKTSKLIVNSILAAANHCYIRACKTAMELEWLEKRLLK